VAGFCVAFSALEVVLRWTAIRRPLAVEREPLLFLTGSIAVIAWLAWLAFSLTCLRERVLIALALVSFTMGALKVGLPGVVAAASPALILASLGLWIVALLVSLSMLRSAMRVRRE
jgi:hypothetical protein